jgi:hypothetical protein
MAAGAASRAAGSVGSQPPFKFAPCRLEGHSKNKPSPKSRHAGACHQTMCFPGSKSATSASRPILGPRQSGGLAIRRRADLHSHSGNKLSRLRRVDAGSGCPGAVALSRPDQQQWPCGRHPSLATYAAIFVPLLLSSPLSQGSPWV